MGFESTRLRLDRLRILGAERLFASEEAYQRTIESVPAGRVGQPEEVANLAYFLLSPEADYINGDCITIDGGQWLNRKSFAEERAIGDVHKVRQDFSEATYGKGMDWEWTYLTYFD